MTDPAHWAEVYLSAPFLSFPPDWEIQFIPPTCGATMRFRVRLRSVPSRTVSVYADYTDTLGSVGQPYWEIYPDAEGGTSRFLLAETYALRFAIQKSLESPE